MNINQFFIIFIGFASHTFNSLLGLKVRLILNDCRLAAIDWQPIALGSSNTLYRGDAVGQSLILRLNADTHFAFGVDRVRESNVLALIKQQLWAPTIIENNLENNWCLMADHGSNIVLNSQTQLDILQWIGQLQIFSQSVELSDQAALYFDHRALFRRYIAVFNQSQNNQRALHLCDLLIAALQTLPVAGEVLMHQDLHLGNVCCDRVQGTATQIKLIDWEYSGWGTPWLDAAALNSHFCISAAQIQQLPSFLYMPQRSFNTGLHKALQFNSGLACVWGYLRFLLASQRDELTAQEQLLGRVGFDRQMEHLIAQC